MIELLKKESQELVKSINELAKKEGSRYHTTFVNIENATLLDHEHFVELTKVLYASDIVFDISLPHEIFYDLTTCQSIRKWEHCAFAFSFYYLIAYLWRSNIHYHVGDKMKLSQMRLKYYITGTKESPTYDYLVKNHGILYKLGYTQKIFDIPVEYKFYKKHLVNIKMLSDLEKEGVEIVEPLPKKLMVHKPLKGYYRFPRVKGDNSDEDELDGHFFTQHQTFKIKTEIFLAIITTKELGFKGFYYYCYLRHLQEVKSRSRGSIGFKKGKIYLQEELGMSDRLIQRYNSKLKEMKIIDVNQLKFKDFNTYFANYNPKQIKLI